eukprot:6236785-Amphidinium_carterae.1
MPTWAEEFLEGAASSSAIGTAATAAAEKEADADDDDVDLSDEVLEAGETLDKLEDQRLAMRESVVTQRRELFRWTMLGGDWAVKRSDKLVVGPRVDVRPGTEFHSFATQHLPNMSASFSHDKYGSTYAVALAELWTERMLDLYEQWQAGGRPADASSIQTAAYTVSEDISARLEGGNAMCAKRAREIKATLMRQTPKRIAVLPCYVDNSGTAL